MSDIIDKILDSIPKEELEEALFQKEAETEEENHVTMEGVFDNFNEKYKKHISEQNRKVSPDSVHYCGSCGQAKPTIEEVLGGEI